MNRRDFLASCAAAAVVPACVERVVTVGGVPVTYRRDLDSDPDELLIVGANHSLVVYLKRLHDHCSPISVQGGDL